MPLRRDSVSTHKAGASNTGYRALDNGNTQLCKQVLFDLC